MLNKLSIRWKLLVYMTFFAGLMLAMLWIYEIIFTENLFERVKTHEIKSTAVDIQKKLYEKDEEAFQDYIDNLSIEQDTCIIITDTNGKLLYSSDNNSGSYIYKLSEAEIMQLKEKVQKDDDQFPVVITENKSSNSNDESDPKLIHVRLYEDYVILLETSVSPPKNMMDIIKDEILYAGGIFLLLTILLTTILTSEITKPIKVMNDKVRNISLGNYDVEFKNKGYLEITQLSDALNYMVKELSQLESLRQELIANISHDIRTPLTAIIGYCELLEDFPEERTQENIRLILSETKWLSSLVNNQLSISKLRANMESLNIIRFNLTKEIEKILLRFTKLYQRDGYVIHFNYQKNVFVEADIIRISQVIYNFVNNALKHTGKDKTVTVNQIIQDDDVLIQVHNSGDPIAEEQLKYIWNRYYRAEDPDKYTKTGMGLGLSIVKSILEIHKAQYGVESSLKDGCTFWFTLKISKADRTARKTAP